jgi:hypothetical protein
VGGVRSAGLARSFEPDARRCSLSLRPQSKHLVAGMSAVRTNAKCRSDRAMSEFGGEPESIYSHRVFRILTQQTLRLSNFTLPKAAR